MEIKKVSVTMPNDTVYVNGIVNGAEYVFTLDGSTAEGTVWTADVARASPDIYVCKITAINSTGSSTTIETTLYYGLQLITDRTARDVQYVAELSAKGLENMTESELEEYLKGMKGAYNAGDLNRVESAVNYLIERLKITGNYLNLLTKTSWTIHEYVALSEAKRYLHNVETIKNCFISPDNMPDVPTDLDNLDFQEANDIEKILYMVDAIITNIPKAWLYSGDIFAGEV